MATRPRRTHGLWQTYVASERPENDDDPDDSGDDDGPVDLEACGLTTTRGGGGGGGVVVVVGWGDAVQMPSLY